jgi:Flp pilus assembly protein TadD
VKDRMTLDDRKTMQAIAVDFHAAAATLLFNQEQVASAEAHLRQALRIAPDSLPTRELLATLYLRTGQLQEARATYEELVRRDPRRATYRVNLGLVLLQLREEPPAVAALRKALELDPKQPEALANLARYFLTTRQNLPEALSLCQRLASAQPTAPNYDLLGWACYANGQRFEALNAITNAIRLQPENPALRERYRRVAAGP